jgi:transaldolase / glucose-6-phosphate isomerase
VVEAYLGGLEHFVGRGGDPSQLVSVASFFVNAAALAGADGTPWDTSERISSVSVRATTALLAYIERNKFNLDRLQEVRLLIRGRKRVGTCLGVGPRLLHSTGQAYKGGPSTGVFLQFTCDDAADLDVPGQRYSFGVVKAAQARSDFAVLADRGRRVLHFGPNVAAGLNTLREAVRKALT